MLLVKANFSLFSYSVFLVLEIKLWNWNICQLNQFNTNSEAAMLSSNFPPDVISLLYGCCFFFDILSQLGPIGAPFGMAFIWPAHTARLYPPNMMINSKTWCDTTKVSYVVCSFRKKCLWTKSVEVIRDENPPRLLARGKGQTLLKCTQIILCSVQNGF